MNKTYENLCINCGKPRIVAKIWEEKIGNSVIINKDMVCPDPACQKKVDQENKRHSDKQAAMRLKSEQRAVQRRVEKDAVRAEKVANAKA